MNVRDRARELVAEALHKHAFSSRLRTEDVIFDALAPVFDVVEADLALHQNVEHDVYCGGIEDSCPRCRAINQREHALAKLTEEASDE